MPISKIDENMKRAQERDAVINQRFWWRKDIFTACRCPPIPQTLLPFLHFFSVFHFSPCSASDDTREPVLEEMSVDEILNGIPGSDYQVPALLSPLLLVAAFCCSNILTGVIFSDKIISYP